MNVSDKVIRNVELNKGEKMESLGRLFAKGDQHGHQFVLTITEGKQPVSLDGAAVSGIFISANGSNIAIPYAEYGSISGNVATLTLPAGCYAVPGHFTLFISITQDNVVHTVFGGEGYIVPSSGNGPSIDPGTVISDINDLITNASSAQASFDRIQEQIDELGGVITYGEQDLTDAQQTQARENIGALGAEEAVLVTAQTLDAATKTQARANIDAINAYVSSTTLYIV